MTNLTLQEATLLKQAIQDHDIRRALWMFFHNQTLDYAERCKNEMIAGDVDKAKYHAHFSLAYDTAFLELEHFVENQIRLISGDQELQRQ